LRDEQCVECDEALANVDDEQFQQAILLLIQRMLVRAQEHDDKDAAETSWQCLRTMLIQRGIIRGE